MFTADPDTEWLYYSDLRSFRVEVLEHGPIQLNLCAAADSDIAGALAHMSQQSAGGRCTRTIFLFRGNQSNNLAMRLCVPESRLWIDSDRTGFLRGSI
jgi:hypothetical protein